MKLNMLGVAVLLTHAVSRRFHRIARVPWLSVMLVGIIGFIGSTAIGLMVGIPEPEVHDEFSYLLASDTFSRGRLTNPTHPLWIHFESMHIIHQPTYMSKFPPAQGGVLALGQVLTGYPIVGVWISAGLMYAAITWMLYSWMAPQWALLGGLIGILHPELGINGYWAQSYLGGAVAATGGALVLGALRRIVALPCRRDALILAVGVALLANSRPYEGLLYCLPAGVVLLIWSSSNNGPGLRIAITQILLPIAALVVLTTAWMGFYNYQITGNAFRMPYLVHEEIYGGAPKFIWQDAYPERLSNHKVVGDFHEAESDVIKRRQSTAGFLSFKIESFRGMWRFFCGTLFTVPLLVMLPVMLPWVFKKRWMLFAVVTSAVPAGGLFVEWFYGPHYAAPITGVVILFILQALRLWQMRDPLLGRFVLCALLVVCVYSLGRSVSFMMTHGRSPDWRQHRAAILRHLEQEPGKHLVVVRYGLTHRVAHEYVFNRADIENAKVLWAREMDSKRNQRLVDYFKDRHVWLLEPDAALSEPSGLNDGPRLQPYRAG